MRLRIPLGSGIPRKHEAVGNVGGPDVIGARRNHSFDAIREFRKGVMGISGQRLDAPLFPCQAVYFHDAGDAFLVDLPSSSLQFFRYFPMTVERQCFKDILDFFFEEGIGSGFAFFSVPAFPAETDGVEKPGERIVRSVMYNQLFVLRYRNPKVSDTFFKNSFWTVNFPIMRSSCAVFFSISSSVVSAAKIRCAFLSRRSRHSPMTVG